MDNDYNDEEKSKWRNEGLSLPIFFKCILIQEPIISHVVLKWITYFPI